MVCSFHNIINLDSLIRDSYRVCFEDISGLIVCQSAALDVVGIVCQIDLSAMIDAAMNAPWSFPVVHQ